MKSEFCLFLCGLFGGGRVGEAVKLFSLFEPVTLGADLRLDVLVDGLLDGLLEFSELLNKKYNKVLSKCVIKRLLTVVNNDIETKEHVKFFFAELIFI